MLTSSPTVVYTVLGVYHLSKGISFNYYLLSGQGLVRSLHNPIH